MQILNFQKSLAQCPGNLSKDSGIAMFSKVFYLVCRFSDLQKKFSLVLYSGRFLFSCQLPNNWSSVIYCRGMLWNCFEEEDWMVRLVLCCSLIPCPLLFFCHAIVLYTTKELFIIFTVSHLLTISLIKAILWSTHFLKFVRFSYQVGYKND